MRDLCQHNGSLDPMGRCNGCGRPVSEERIDLELLLDAERCSAMVEFANRDDDDNDGPPYSAEDTIFLALSAMPEHLRARAELYLRESPYLLGYPWEISAEMRGRA